MVNAMHDLPNTKELGNSMVSHDPLHPLTRVYVGGSTMGSLQDQEDQMDLEENQQRIAKQNSPTIISCGRVLFAMPFFLTAMLLAWFVLLVSLGGYLFNWPILFASKKIGALARRIAGTQTKQKPE